MALELAKVQLPRATCESSVRASGGDAEDSLVRGTED